MSTTDQLYCNACDSFATIRDAFGDWCQGCYLDANPSARPDFDRDQEYHSDDDPRYTSRS